MPYYQCVKCNYNTKLRTDYKRHLTTKKHNLNLIQIDDKPDIIDYTLINEPFSTLNEPFSTLNEPFSTLNEPFFESKTHILKKKTYICEFCNKAFGTKSHLTRHIRLHCKVKKEKVAKQEQELIEGSKKDKQIEILQNTVNKLMSKVGNTTITNNQVNNNNVNLNVFGKENLEMVTDDFKKELIKGPYKMMPKLLEMIYFNKEYPENHTMKLVNKNKEVMKVHKKKGWEYVDKADTIDYVLEDKNYEVDNFYDTNTDDFSQFVKRTYKNFRRLFDNRDKELWKQIQRDVDLLLWNNM